MLFKKLKNEKERKKKEKFIDYEFAKEEFNNHTLSLAKNTSTWKKISFFCIALMSVSIAGMTYLSTRSTLIPYVIEVDQTGNAKAINPAYQINYNPTDANKQYVLKEWLKNARWITSDRVVQNRLTATALKYCSIPMQEKLRTYYANEDMSNLILNKMTRDIEIKNIVGLAGTDNTYQAKWTETTYTSAGEIDNKTNYIGIFTLTIVQPKTIKELDINPLGIVIKDFNFSKEK